VNKIVDLDLLLL